ncbi:MAG: 50S ribosomal protein L21 [Flavobacteriales bacterium]|nr:50S ribosomal protein L21 [Flavobacteriales bacterium]
MYAIVEIAGHQYKVEKDQLIYVNRLKEDEGAKVSFDRVLLLDDNGNVSVGAPAIGGAQVTAKVEKHLKGDKVIVFKKKRRKGYRKKNGFRAYLTELRIESIVASGAKPAKAAAPKKEEAPKKEAPKKESAPKKAEGGDKLTKIEGIGPKISEILTNAGVATFADLAAADVEKLKEILAEAGNRYKAFDPTTWPQQAALAADGKWDELKELQDNLDGGRAN